MNPRPVYFPYKAILLSILMLKVATRCCWYLDAVEAVFDLQVFATVQRALYLKLLAATVTRDTRDKHIN